MNCLKCGRKLEGDHAFCPKCLEQMAACPVRPDTVIKLPNRQEATPKKPTSRKKVRTPEEQIKHLKKTNARLIIALCLLAIVASLLVFLSVDYIKQLDVQRFLGQNYSTVETMK